LKLIQPIFEDHAYPPKLPVVLSAVTLYAAPLPAPALVELKLIQPTFEDQPHPERSTVAALAAVEIPAVKMKARRATTRKCFFMGK
jgi:hypothetical protein